MTKEVHVSFHKGGDSVGTGSNCCLWPVITVIAISAVISSFLIMGRLLDYLGILSVGFV
jgi:hypothetical protein